MSITFVILLQKSAIGPGSGSGFLIINSLKNFVTLKMNFEVIIPINIANVVVRKNHTGPHVNRYIREYQAEECNHDEGNLDWGF